jgi:hypothetical protein
LLPLRSLSVKNDSAAPGLGTTRRQGFRADFRVLVDAGRLEQSTGGAGGQLFLPGVAVDWAGAAEGGPEVDISLRFGRISSVALSLCATARPLYSRFTEIIGTTSYETTMRPNRRRRVPRTAWRATRLGWSGCGGRRLAGGGRTCGFAQPGGRGRARSYCRFLLPLVHFTPDSRTYSVPVFMKRRCDRTPGRGRRRSSERTRLSSPAGRSIPVA